MTQNPVESCTAYFSSSYLLPMPGGPQSHTLPSQPSFPDSRVPQAEGFQGNLAGREKAPGEQGRVPPRDPPQGADARAPVPAPLPCNNHVCPKNSGKFGAASPWAEELLETCKPSLLSSCFYSLFILPHHQTNPGPLQRAPTSEKRLLASQTAFLLWPFFLLSYRTLTNQ